jgi:multidrug resistance efflux pump/transcriptional regulator with GAF, ATPase, and Fis domain
MADAGDAAWRLAADLARSRSEAQLSAAIARAAGTLTEADATRVWSIDREKGYRFSGAWPQEPESPQEPLPGVVKALASGTAIAGPGPQPFRSHLIVPLSAGRKPLGAMELLERSRPAGAFSPKDASSLTPVVDAADGAFEGIRERSAREVNHFEAITRLTRLVDVSRTLASTLDLDLLTRFIANRVRASLEVEQAYLWLVDDSGEKLTMAAAEGTAAEAVKGWLLPFGEGCSGRVAATLEATLMNDPEEIAGFEERPDVAAGLEIRGIAAVPIKLEEGNILGVIEVVNRQGDESLEEGDVSFLKVVAETAAISLGNVRRVEAERRATDLGALLETAQALGASLEVPKVSFTLVHKAASILHYRQAAVGLVRGGRFELVAVSGKTFVDEKLPETKALKGLLDWASGLPEGIYVVQEEDGNIDTARPETQEQFKAYFEMTGSRSFLTVPLADDVGRVGLFALEAVEPYAFTTQAMEASRLLAVQATIAIRNATLYQQIPMARVFRPLARSKQKFQDLPRSRRIAWITALGLAVITLLLPVPLRVSGDARVLPDRRLPVAAQVEGRVAQVYVREGDRVDAGQVLAVLDDTDYRIGEEDARTRYEMARIEQSRLRAVARTADALAENARLDGLHAEMDLWKTRLAATRIRALASGLVATPHIEELVGSRLAQGDLFCEIVDPGRQRIEVMLPESETGLVAAGMPVKVKLYAFPARSYEALVERVSVAATVREDERFFLVQARLVDADIPLRSGMTGLAKISTGRAPVARVLFRRPARWLWEVIWGWLP